VRGAHGVAPRVLLIILHCRSQSRGKARERFHGQFSQNHRGGPRSNYPRNGRRHPLHPSGGLGLLSWGLGYHHGGCGWGLGGVAAGLALGATAAAATPYYYGYGYPACGILRQPVVDDRALLLVTIACAFAIKTWVDATRNLFRQYCLKTSSAEAPPLQPLSQGLPAAGASI
jgi:hypothetical protein